MSDKLFMVQYPLQHFVVLEMNTVLVIHFPFSPVGRSKKPGNCFHPDLGVNHRHFVDHCVFKVAVSKYIDQFKACHWWMRLM